MAESKMVERVARARASTLVALVAMGRASNQTGCTQGSQRQSMTRRLESRALWSLAIAAAIVVLAQIGGLVYALFQ